MSISTSLKCSKCKKFLELGNWSLKGYRVQNISLDMNDLKEALEKVKTAVDQDQYFSRYPEEHWMYKLIPFIEKFRNTHLTHGIEQWTIDVGDPPWSLGQQNWYEWEEMVGPETFYEELYLPKNIINELKLLTWKEAKKYYTKNPYTTDEDYEIIEREYKKLLTSNKTIAFGSDAKNAHPFCGRYIY